MPVCRTPRFPRITQELSTILKEHFFPIAFGYEETNNAAFLAREPVLEKKGLRPMRENQLLEPQYRGSFIGPQVYDGITTTYRVHVI